jgi:protein-L-isoaspartate(D-aspartate) O-methyltransferase
MESVDFNNMRRAMVDSQLRTSGVTSPWVIAAMGKLAREDFVPDALRTTAYMDRSLPMPGGRTLNPPVAIALMLQAADVASDDQILLIGAPGGYVHNLLLARAKDVMVVDTTTALPDSAFSLILIDGAVEQLPETLLSRAREGARIVTGVTERGVTRLASGLVRGGKVALRPFADTEVAILPEFARPKEFVF